MLNSGHVTCVLWNIPSTDKVLSIQYFHRTLSWNRPYQWWVLHRLLTGYITNQCIYSPADHGSSSVAPNFYCRNITSHKKQVQHFETPQDPFRQACDKDPITCLPKGSCAAPKHCTCFFCHVIFLQ